MTNSYVNPRLDGVLALSVFKTQADIGHSLFTNEYSVLFQVKILDKVIRYTKITKTLPFTDAEIGKYTNELSIEFNTILHDCIDWDKVLKKFPTLRDVNNYGLALQEVESPCT